MLVRGQAGDALIELKLRPHPYFEREGDDIILDLPITIDEAILGGKVEAPTIDGRDEFWSWHAALGPDGIYVVAEALSGDQTFHLQRRDIATGAVLASEPGFSNVAVTVAFASFPFTGTTAGLNVALAGPR